MRTDESQVGANIRLFGGFRAELDGAPVHIRTRPAQCLLARLCLAPDGKLSRTQIASDLWPDEPYDVSGNRLRTSLVIVKQALEPSHPVDGDRTSIWIEWSGCQTDVAEARVLLRKVRVLQDLDQELEALTALSGLIDSPLLAGFEDDWILPFRSYWIEQRTKLWLRRAQIGLESGQLPDTLEAVEKALEQDEFNPDAWMRLLRALAHLDRANEATERFRIAQSKMKRLHDAVFPKEVERVAARVARGSILPAKSHYEFSAAEKQLLIGALEHMAAHDPRGFQQVLGSNSFRSQVFRKPFAAFHLVLDSLEQEGVDSEVRVAAIRSGLTASVTLNEHGEIEKLCRALIESSAEETADHIIALQQLSFVKFEQRDWDAAYALSDRALTLAREHQPAQVQFVLTGIGSLDFHRGKLKEAESAYLAALESYSDESDFRSRRNTAMILSNLAFVKLTERDLQSAHDYALDAWRRMAVEGLDAVKSSTSVLFGFTQVALGKPEGIRLIADGLMETYRNRNLRFVEIGIDLAAGALACLDEGPTALAVLGAITPLRDGRRHSRSPAEELFAAGVREIVGASVQPADWPPFDSLLELTMRVCSELEGQLRT